jgi:hypothetical protein
MPWLILGLLLGFLAGLFAFRVKSRWCPECGAATTALEARRHTGAGA